jgi:cell wall-associated NlpC family hydrolase
VRLTAVAAGREEHLRALLRLPARTTAGWVGPAAPQPGGLGSAHSQGPPADCQTGKTKERVTPVGTGSSVIRSLPRQAGPLTALVLAVATVVSSAGGAGAAPQPSIGQVRDKINRLMSLEDQAVQQYDQAVQVLASARQRLALLNSEVSRDRVQFQTMRAKVAQIATAAYENGNMTSFGALLTNPNPQTVIAQASILQHLSSDRTAELNRVIATARQYSTAQQMAQRTELAVTALEKQRLAKREVITAAVAKQQALLAQLTTQQQTLLSGGAITSATYTGPTNTPEGKSVAFSYGQLGKPYVWGATGPGSYDCSGLVQAAWASAGVAIPRTTYEQWAALPHVSMSAIQPGDLIFFDGIGHVAIYVGNNMIIDAPQPGEFVELISLSSSWYASTLDGAARP